MSAEKEGNCVERSAKIHELAPGIMLHWCPGCKMLHPIHTDKKNSSGAVWTYDGNHERPTFSPSINIVGYCHYFITEGRIMFCSDSTHALAGRTVDLPDIPVSEKW